MKDLWVPISGAIAQQRNVETIANNVANANTPGFKKDQTVFKEYLSAYEKGTDIDLPNKEWAPEDFYRSYGAEKAQVKVDGSYTNFQQGQLTPTNNPLDVAINGPAFFEVMTSNGIRYTRKGNLTVNNNGQLVTDRGDLILKKIELPETGSGDDLAGAIQQIPKPEERGISLPQGRVSINREGELFVNNQKVADLSVVEFKDPHSLRKEGNSYFINSDSKNIKTDLVKSTVNQGFMEQSNVNAVEEMSNLIKAHRQFESIQRVIKAYDNVAGKASNEIARF